MQFNSNEISLMAKFFKLFPRSTFKSDTELNMAWNCFKAGWSESKAIA